MKRTIVGIASSVVLIIIVGISLYKYKHLGAVVPVSPDQSASAYKYEHPGPDMSFSPDDWGPEFLGLLQSGPKYLSAELPINLPPPPTSWSQQTANEIKYLHSLENQRTPENNVILNEENTKPLPGFFKQVGIATSTKPKTLALMGKVANEMGYFLMREKWKYQRARAYQIDPTLTTVVPHPPHPAYPSGHAGQSRAVALLLSDLDPVHKDIYISYGALVGTNRELGGVHYPSDTLAGVSLANQVMPQLFQNPEFKAILEEVRADEWR